MVKTSFFPILTLSMILSIMFLFSCKKEVNYTLYTAQIPFTMNNMYIGFTDSIFLLYEQEEVYPYTSDDILMTRQVSIQTGDIYKDHLVDAISGEKYYYRKIGGTIIFITGRYTGLVFNILETYSMGMGDDIPRDLTNIFGNQIENYIKEINGIKIDKSFHLDLNERIVYSSEDGYLKLVLDSDSTYSYYRYDYLIDYGNLTLNHNFLKLESEPRISDEEIENYDITMLLDNIYVQHKVFLNDSLLLLGTLPYGFSEKHLKRIE